MKFCFWGKVDLQFHYSLLTAVKTQGRTNLNAMRRTLFCLYIAVSFALKDLHDRGVMSAKMKSFKVVIYWPFIWLQNGHPNCYV